MSRPQHFPAEAYLAVEQDYLDLMCGGEAPKFPEPFTLEFEQFRISAQGVGFDASLKVCGMCLPNQTDFSINDPAIYLHGKTQEALAEAMAYVEFYPLYPADPALLARMTNRGLYMLGYTEGNPESEPLELPLPLECYRNPLHYKPER